MVKAAFEHQDDIGVLKLETHFGKSVEIECSKNTDEIFRLGGTAINDIAFYEGVVTKLTSPYSSFKAFYNAEKTFNGVGLLSDEKWDTSDLHCYVTEYYPLDMEGKKPEWIISKRPIKDANHLFVNLDIIDGGGNPIKRYRVSPFTGEWRLING